MKSIAAALFALLLPAAALAAPPTLDAVQTDPVLQPAAGAKASKGDNPAAVQTDPVLRRAGGAADGVAGRLAQMKAGEAWSGRLDRHVAKGKHPLATDLRKLQSAVKSLKKGKRSLAQAAAMARLEAGLADFEGAVDADAADRALGQVRGALSDLNP